MHQTILRSSWPAAGMLVLAVLGCDRSSDNPGATATSNGIVTPMTRDQFRARVGVACITPDLLDEAFARLPIGFYKDFHPLGFAHHDESWAQVSPFQPYVPTIQWAGIGDTPDLRAMLRAAADSGRFPMPAGVAADDLIGLLEFQALENWLVEQSTNGRFTNGTIFCMGNEPGYRPNHDARTPEQLVEDAMRLKDLFERHDLDHRISLGGISSPDNAFQRAAYGDMTPMAFFESVLEHARAREFRFDAFMIHPYPFDNMELPEGLPETDDAALFTGNSIAQVRSMRAIMARFDHRDTPLIIGETGMPFAIGSDPAALATDYADEFLTWCLTATDESIGNPSDGDRLVQRFIWFMLALPDAPTPGVTDHPLFVWNHTMLMTPTGQLTTLGRRFNEVADRLAKN